MKKTIVTVVMLLVIFSCSKKTVPTASTNSSSIPVDLVVGENMFKETCVSCHKLPESTKHTAAQWPNVVERMQRKKQGFDEAHKVQITAYLVANARQ